MMKATYVQLVCTEAMNMRPTGPDLEKRSFNDGLPHILPYIDGGEVLLTISE